MYKYCTGAFSFQVFIKMIDLETDHEFNWTREKFINRKFVMQEMFENYTDGDEWQLPAVRLLTLFSL